MMEKKDERRHGSLNTVQLYRLHTQKCISCMKYMHYPFNVWISHAMRPIPCVRKRSQDHRILKETNFFHLPNLIIH